jgi:phosphoribosylanthranilate isomerase
MFRIKVCGITSVDDGVAVAQAGADAIGLNFYRRSPRYVEPETALEIVESLPAAIVKVGLFVDRPAEDICRLYDELRLNLVQLHGDQPPEFVAQLGGRPTMRAFRVGAEGLGPVNEYLARCQALGAPLKLVMLDAMVAGQYGGTGQTADWTTAHQYTEIAGAPPLVLAGGLTPENVGEAIRAVRPSAVDVASGVEWRPGRKDPAAIGRFVEAARVAFGP